MAPYDVDVSTKPQLLKTVPVEEGNPEYRLIMDILKDTPQAKPDSALQEIKIFQDFEGHMRRMRDPDYVDGIRYLLDGDIVQDMATVAERRQRLEYRVRGFELDRQKTELVGSRGYTFQSDRIGYPKDTIVLLGSSFYYINDENDVLAGGCENLLRLDNGTDTPLIYGSSHANLFRFDEPGVRKLGIAHKLWLNSQLGRRKLR